MGSIPPGARRQGQRRHGLAYATITALISAYQVQVRVEGISDGDLPAEVGEGPWTAGLATATGGSPSHSHGLEPSASQLAVGNRVVVGFFDGSPQRPFVIARVPAAT